MYERTSWWVLWTHPAIAKGLPGRTGRGESWPFGNCSLFELGAEGKYSPVPLSPAWVGSRNEKPGICMMEDVPGWGRMYDKEKLGWITFAVRNPCCWEITYSKDNDINLFIKVEISHPNYLKFHFSFVSHWQSDFARNFREGPQMTVFLIWSPNTQALLTYSRLEALLLRSFFHWMLWVIAFKFCIS